MEFLISAVWWQLVNFFIGKDKAMCGFESFNLANLKILFSDHENVSWSLKNGHNNSCN